MQIKIFKRLSVFLFCIGWIFITNYKYYPLNSAGEILTFGPGLLSLPTQEKDHIQSSQYQASIYIDSLGIPHIYGNDETAVSFGLGYMHARDRYFQMEFTTRLVEGKLAEILGERGVAADKFWRFYDFTKLARQTLNDYKLSNPRFYEYLKAYSNGVNTYLNNNETNDP